MVIGWIMEWVLGSGIERVNSGLNNGMLVIMGLELRLEFIV